MNPFDPEGPPSGSRASYTEARRIKPFFVRESRGSITITHDILRKPRGTTYRSLVTAALTFCDAFTLIRHDSQYAETANIMEEQLRPCLLRTERTNEWPGADLLSGAQATLSGYRLTPVSAVVLADVKSLYAWRGPALPEDLAFWAGDRCWLGSIAHERDAFVCLDNLNAKMVKKRIPTLRLRKARSREHAL